MEENRILSNGNILCIIIIVSTQLNHLQAMSICPIRKQQHYLLYMVLLYQVVCLYLYLVGANAKYVFHILQCMYGVLRLLTTFRTLHLTS